MNRDLLVEMALNLSLPELVNLCRTSKQINRDLCDSKYFWLRKLKKDYGVTRIDQDPKNVYRKIYENKEFCENIGSFLPSEIFLQRLPDFLINQRDPIVYNYLLLKLFKKIGPSQVDDAEIRRTFNRYVDQYNTSYGNVLTDNPQLSPEETNLLREIITGIKDSIQSNKKPLYVFLTSFLNSVLRGNVPMDALTNDLCKYNLY